MRELHVFPNGYYNYKKNRKNAKQKQKSKLLKLIKTMYHSADGTPGYRTIQKALKNNGRLLSPQTVRKYMNVELGLKSVTRKKKKRYVSGPDAYVLFDNLLEQNFKADEKNTKWCIDFTYIYFGNKRRYNCTIIDLYDRRVVASVNNNRINTQLAIETLNRAFERSGKKGGMILHSDRGSQFTAKVFVEYCRERGVTQSMSKPGCPYDNAPMERYFNTLKTEHLNIHEYETEADLYLGINCYAYGYYNNQRPHTYNGGLPPAKVA